MMTHPIERIMVQHSLMLDLQDAPSRQDDTSNTNLEDLQTETPWECVGLPV
jgi:hypothetical protein